MQPPHSIIEKSSVTYNIEDCVYVVMDSPITFVIHADPEKYPKRTTWVKLQGSSTWMILENGVTWLSFTNKVSESKHAVPGIV